MRLLIILFFPFILCSQAKTITQLRDSLDYVFYNEVISGRTDQQELMDTSNGGNGGDLYWNLENGQGLLSAFMGSGHRDYLNQLIISCNNWIDSSVISSSDTNSGYADSYKGWTSNSSTSITGQGIAAPGAQNDLYDSRGWMAYAKMLWVLKNSPNLRAESTIVDGKTYQQHYDDILAFTQTHIWEKWETRKSNDILSSNAVDESAAFANIGMWLYECTNIQKYKDVFDDFNTGSSYGMRNHIQNNDFDSNAWQWCLRWDCAVTDGNDISDHGHASRAVKLMTDANLVGRYWTNSDMVKLMNTFKVIAPLGSDGRTAYKWMNRDDSGGDDNRPKYHEGFTSSSRSDETYQQRLENKTTVYETLASVNIGPKTNMFGELIFNRAYLNGTVQYPENFYSNPTRQMPINVKAFPTAQGWASEITGGRGGSVYHVTTTASSGAGSLSNGLQTGNVNIVFDVSGIFDLGDINELPLSASNFTVHGQTAPQGGVTITNAPISMGGDWSLSSQACNNGIWRYVRFINARYTGVADVYLHNGFISTGSNGIMFDHCQFLHNDDQAVSLNANNGDLTYITFQKSLFSENATGIIFGINAPNGATGYYSVIRCLFAHNSHRNPNSAYDGLLEIINNTYFNWAHLNINLNGRSPLVNHIGNYYQRGTYTGTNRNIVQSGSGATPLIYTSNNYDSELYTTPQLNDTGLWTQSGSPLPGSMHTTSIHQLSPNTEILTASESYEKTITNADIGTYAYISDTGELGTYYDSYLLERINDVKTLTSRDPGNKSWTMPTFLSNTRASGFYNPAKSIDIPEFWVDAHNITSNNQIISSYVINGETVPNPGYGAFEFYTQIVARDHLAFALSQGSSSNNKNKIKAHNALTMGH